MGRGDGQSNYSFADIRDDIPMGDNCSPRADIAEKFSSLTAACSSAATKSRRSVAAPAAASSRTVRREPVTARCTSRSASPPCQKQQKPSMSMAKDDCDVDDHLNGNVDDLPEDVREQFRQLVANNCARAGNPESSNANGRSRNDDHFPLSKPRRLSAQPTVKEIKMCFAQMDMAILMESRMCMQPRIKGCPSPSRRNARRSGSSGGMRQYSDTESQMLDPAFDSDFSSCYDVNVGY